MALSGIFSNDIFEQNTISNYLSFERIDESCMTEDTVEKFISEQKALCACDFGQQALVLCTICLVLKLKKFKEDKLGHFSSHNITAFRC